MNAEEAIVFTTLLASLYIQNHPDHRGFTGSKLELLAWGRRAGLVSPLEEKTVGAILTESGFVGAQDSLRHCQLQQTGHY